jgi:hypothetical protein
VARVLQRVSLGLTRHDLSTLRPSSSASATSPWRQRLIGVAVVCLKLCDVRVARSSFISYRLEKFVLVFGHRNRAVIDQGVSSWSTAVVRGRDVVGRAHGVKDRRSRSARAHGNLH